MTSKFSTASPSRTHSLEGIRHKSVKPKFRIDRRGRNEGRVIGRRRGQIVSSRPRVAILRIKQRSHQRTKLISRVVLAVRLTVRLLQHHLSICTLRSSSPCTSLRIRNPSRTTSSVPRQNRSRQVL